MKVLLIANFGESDYSLLKYFESGLKTLGHHTRWVSLLPGVDLAEYLPTGRLGLFKAFTKRAAGRLIRSRLFWDKEANFESLKKEVEGFKPEFIITVKGTNLDRKILKYLLDKGLPVFNYFSDPIPLDHKKFLETIPLYSCIFTFNKEFVAQWRSLDAKDVVYLPFASDPQAHKPALLTKEEKDFYASPVAYLATWQPGCEYWPEKILKFGLKVWGNQWYRLSSGSPLKKAWQGEERGTGKDFAAVCSASEIIFNQVREHNGQSHSMKTFEIPACGGFMLAKRTDEQVGFFPEDKAAVYFSTEEELLDKVRFYLSHAEKRKTIAAKGFEIAKSHRYSHRMQKVIEYFRQLVGS